MQKLLLLLRIVAFISLFSCNNSDKKSADQSSVQPAVSDTIKKFSVQPTALMQDYKSWYTYTYYKVRLAMDFMPLGVDSDLVSKPAFLKALATGNYIAAKVAEVKSVPVYKLYRINATDENIRKTAKQLAEIAIELMNKEGQKIPDFNLTDINGVNYSSANTRGKILVIKCWFIHCVACVKEFPELNQLVEKYKNRNDILFVSLATDSKPELESFLASKKFSYAVVPNAGPFMKNNLDITSYPTHLLIDKNGIIQKVTNKIEDLIPSLEKLAQ